MSQILVTGGTGMLGSHIVKKLISIGGTSGLQIVATTSTLSDSQKVKDFYTAVGDSDRKSVRLVEAEMLND